MKSLELLLPLVAVAIRLVPGPRIVDDAYITFRYARNLILGHGLVYNPGQYVLGTTTPLYTVLLAAIGLLSGSTDVERVAWILNALLDAIGVILVVWLGKQLVSNPQAGLAAGLLWAIAPYSVTFAIGGLETSLVITLVLAAFASYLSRRWVLCGLFLGLATLTRPDALIAAAVLFAAIGLEHLAAAWRSGRVALMRPLFLSVGVFASTIGPWVAYAILTYGSPLPNSLSAKAVAYRLPPEAALVRLLQHFASPFHEHLVWGGVWVAIGLVLYGSLFALGGLRAARLSRTGLAALAYPLVYATVYAIANPLLFRWYLSPPVPFWYLGVIAGSWVLAEGVGKERGLLAAALKGGAVLAAVVLLVNAWTLEPDERADRFRPAPRMAWIELERLYEEVAADITEEGLCVDCVLAAGDIGALGWFTEAPILDLVGLISPQVIQYYPLHKAAYVIAYAVSADLVLAELPDVVVILEVYGRNTLLASTDFLSEYELWRSYPTSIYGSEAMMVFARRIGDST